tara:strand:+ start:878 stop:1078 length:201 start_codon:yes stop_codon:yes gene_type:complete
MVAKEITSTKSKQKPFDPNLKEELIKQGIDPDSIEEYGDVDFIDGIDGPSTPNDSWDEYGDDSNEY